MNLRYMQQRESIYALQTSVYAFSFAISMAARNKPSALSICQQMKDLGATVDSVEKEKTSAGSYEQFSSPTFTF